MIFTDTNQLQLIELEFSQLFPVKTQNKFSSHFHGEIFILQQLFSWPQKLVLDLIYQNLEKNLDFAPFCPLFGAHEADVLKITKNCQKRPQISPAASLMNFSSKNNCKQSLPIKKIHFWTFLVILGHFQAIFHIFTVGGTYWAIAQKQLAKHVPIFEPETLYTHRERKINTRELVQFFPKNAMG